MSGFIRSPRLVLGCVLVLTAIGAGWWIDRVDAQSGMQPTLANPPAQTSSKSGTSSKSSSSTTLATSDASQTFDEQIDAFPSTYPPAPMKPGDKLVFNGSITGRKYSDPRDDTLPLTIDYSKNVQSLQAALASGPKGATLRFEFTTQIAGGGPVDPVMVLPQTFRVTVFGADKGGSAASKYSLVITAK